eukprot:354352-Chlamydomonas_euryale.AAC.2
MEPRFQGTVDILAAHMRQREGARRARSAERLPAPFRYVPEPLWNRLTAGQMHMGMTQGMPAGAAPAGRGAAPNQVNVAGAK